MDKSDYREMMPSVPFVVHESEIMRMEKHARRLWIALIVMIIAIIVSNLLWMWYSRQVGFVGDIEDGVENCTEVSDENAEH